MSPLTNKEKQEAFRAKREMLGMTEVRGIFLPPDQHAKLKEYAKGPGLTSDQRYWLERREQIIEALAAEGLEILSDKASVWLRRIPK